MYSKILIADRGEIAVRILKTCKRLGIKTVIVYSEADKDGLPAKLADESYCIGPPDIKSSYMNMDGILSVARYTSSEAVHPGYGVLSEKEEFARLCAVNGFCYIGPSSECIQIASNKYKIKAVAENLAIPVIKGYMLNSGGTLITDMPGLGYPLMIKRVNSGGGDGIYVIRKKDEYDKFLSAHYMEEGVFYAEKLLEKAKHIEVQILGDRKGQIYILGDRDCSIQHNHKKIIEECPAASISNNTRALLYQYARNVAKEVNYRNAGTVEFLVDDEENVYFMEFNARLQVEHGITELVTGLDIVELQLRVACGEEISGLRKPVRPMGHALECRIYAESTGKISEYSLPQGDTIRIDHALIENMKITPYYDPLIGKVMVQDADRKKCIASMNKALKSIRIDGIETNLGKVREIICHERFKAGSCHTDFMNTYMADGHKSLIAGARKRILEISDPNAFHEYYPELTAKNCIQFDGYEEKLQEAWVKSKEKESVITGTTKIGGMVCAIFSFEAGFLMGSMGLAAGEKIARTFEMATDKKIPVVSITASGGARMQEGIFALYQMSKTANAVRQHSEKGLLYVSIISNPSLGGVSASFASLADIILMEEDAVYGFTGKRIIEETTGQKLPDEFQTADFMLRHGQVDRIVKRENLRDEVIAILKLHLI